MVWDGLEVVWCGLGCFHGPDLKRLKFTHVLGTQANLRLDNSDWSCDSHVIKVEEKW